MFAGGVFFLRKKGLLGGAGVAIAHAALTNVNLTDCLRLQNSDLNWNDHGADWRVTRCLARQRSAVKLIQAPFMWMVSDKLDCGAHGPAACKWGFDRTACPLTMHYMSPAATAAQAARAEAEARRGEVCLPASKTGECGCEPASGGAAPEPTGAAELGKPLQAFVRHNGVWKLQWEQSY